MSLERRNTDNISYIKDFTRLTGDASKDILPLPLDDPLPLPRSFEAYRMRPEYRLRQLHALQDYFSNKYAVPTQTEQEQLQAYADRLAPAHTQVVFLTDEVRKRAQRDALRGLQLTTKYKYLDTVVGQLELLITESEPGELNPIPLDHMIVDPKIEQAFPEYPSGLKHSIKRGKEEAVAELFWKLGGELATVHSNATYQELKKKRELFSQMKNGTKVVWFSTDLAGVAVQFTYPPLDPRQKNQKLFPQRYLLVAGM